MCVWQQQGTEAGGVSFQREAGVRGGRLEPACGGPGGPNCLDLSAGQGGARRMT